MTSPLSGKQKKRLFTKIRTQIEFYFSDSNLAKDYYLKNLIDQNSDRYIDIEVFKTFNKVKTLTQDANVIAEAISRSSILEVNSEKTKVRRRTQIESKDFDACTLYVEKIPPNADIKWMKDIFEHFGTVDYVNIPRFKASNRIKGFAFVEFKTPEGVSKACEYYKNAMDKVDSDISKKHDNLMHENSDRKCKIEVAVQNTTADLSLLKGLKQMETENNGKDSNSDIDESNTKKRKHEDVGDNPLKRIKLSNEKNHLDDVTSEMNSELCEPEEGVIERLHSKTKRKRKHKKKLIERPVFRVMSKYEWKSYRNKYLNLQRRTMSLLKNQILMQMHEFKESSKMPRESPKKGIPFQAGVILKIDLREPVLEPATLKEEIKANGQVAFIDAPLGSSEVHLRCCSAEDAQSILQEEKLMNLGTIQLLKGAEEERYWNKITEDRNARFKSVPAKKKRGRDKIIAKAAKLAQMKNKHIYFDE